MKIKEAYFGYYSTGVYLPFSSLSRRWRRFVKGKREKEQRFLQDTKIPGVPWKRIIQPGRIRIVEHQKENGNVRSSELGLLSHLAKNCEDGTLLFEIGTFDGRTTMNLALNSPPRCRVITLDLPPGEKTRYALENGEMHFVHTKTGHRYKKYAAVYPARVEKITQELGDSAQFDFSDYYESCALVFVDGSHAYDYAVSDTQAAMRLVRTGGVVIWHDYGMWEGVTKALEELEEKNKWGLRHIAGTSLVYWKNP